MAQKIGDVAVVGGGKSTQDYRQQTGMLTALYLRAIRNLNGEG